MQNTFLTLLVWWVTLLLLSGCGKARPSWAAPQVCNDAKCFTVELADTPKELTQWLMWVEEMAEDEGMLFVFQTPGRNKFWMKNTLIPLDMLWLAEDGVVLYMKEYAPPCSEEDSKNDNCQLFGPPEGTQAKYVLEVNANTARSLGISEWVQLGIYNVN